MSQEQSRQFVEQATQSVQSGQFEGALQLVDQALAINPADPDAHILRGICLSQTGQPAAATEAFQRAMYLDPNSSKARYNLAVHQYAQGQKSEALRLAREAASLDASHSGARQLISNLEAELNQRSTSAGPNPNDPLAAPPISQSPPATMPSANPYAGSPVQGETARNEPSMPGAPPAPYSGPTNLPPVTNPYAKPAYSGPVHSIPFVENLGGAWLGIGWFLAALSFLGFIVGVIIVVGAFQAGNLNDPESFNRAMNSSSGLTLISQIAGYGSLLGIIIWSIMDLIDRRGNFVWLIPNIICSCCGFGWITLPIYILAGRNN